MCTAPPELPPPPRNTAYIGLGSNQGDARGNLATALRELARLPGLELTAASSVYRTEPQGLREQPFFYNQVAGFACDASVRPEALLEALQAIERSLGRIRRAGKRFGPRTLDLDLLLFGNQRMNSPYLELPHPRMLERAFVLVPLAEIAPDLSLPQGMTVSRALARIPHTRRDDIIFQDAFPEN